MKSCKNWKNKGNSMHPYIHSVVNLWKTEKIAANIWFIWRKVVNLHSKRWRKVVKQSPKTLRKKSGEKYKKHASLDAAVKDYTDKIHRSIVLSRYNVSRTDDVLYLPLYMTIFI